MTSNQIAYTKQREEARHNAQTEADYRWKAQMDRDTAMYAANVSQRNAELNYNAAINAANLNYAAAMRNAELNAQIQRERLAQEQFIANQNLNNLMFNQDAVNAETHRHNLATETVDTRKVNQGAISTIGKILSGAASAVKLATSFLV